MPQTAGTHAPQGPFTAEQLAYFQQRLLEERKRALRELGKLSETFNAAQDAADGDLSTYPFHMADQGTDAMEQEKTLLLASQEGRFLWHIDEALRRLYRTPERFGICHSCEQPIAYERLDALPHARFCFACKQREESANAAKAASSGPATDPATAAGSE